MGSNLVALSPAEWKVKEHEWESLTQPSRRFLRRRTVDPSLSPHAGSGTLKEDRDAWSVTIVLENEPARVRTAIVSWPKASFDDWWKQEKESISPVIDVPSHGYSSVDLSLHPCTDDTWSSIRFGVPEARAYHSALWTGSEMIVWGGGVGEYLQTGGRYDPATDTWLPTSTGAGVPEGRIGHSAIWTGREMIVWGGYSVFSPNVSRYNTGGRYDPTTDSWRPTSVDGTTPEARYGHSAVWTGTEMIVWGGTNDATNLGTGGRYNPLSDTWRATSAGENNPGTRLGHSAVWTGSEMLIYSSGNGAVGRYDPVTDSWKPSTTAPFAPTPRLGHQVVWTGTEMIVWGGFELATYRTVNTGARYRPADDVWTPMSTGANVPAGVGSESAVWTGDEMIVWGGGGYPSPSGSGARYAPSTDTWKPVSALNAPSARSSHTAVWTGKEMIVWGGLGKDAVGDGTSLITLLLTGGRYDASTDTWVPTGTGGGAPTPRYGQSAIWTGSEMIVWGGTDGLDRNTGGRYNPVTDSWTATSTGENVPAARRLHTAVWTGKEMVIWGGMETRLSTGGRYDPASDQWRATATDNAPIGRFAHTAVWTGHEMIVWGGYSFELEGQVTNSGGRYDPSSDRWTATSTTGLVPSARYYHTAVWTGSEMIVWGGVGTTFDKAGSRYRPSTDTWQATSLISAPSARVGHTAIWTGRRMIVWGGIGGKKTGAQYDPAADAWTSTSTVGAPAGRQGHSVVWTGDEMIVWGGFDDPYHYLNTGGRYQALSNTWRPTSLGDLVPVPAIRPTSVWTGTQMIVLGGSAAAAYCAQAACTVVTWYRDADQDGYGNSADPVLSCDQPPGYVAKGGDCNDSDPTVNPAAPDLPGDAVDQDCDGTLSCDPSADYPNHGEFVSCVSHAADDLLNRQLITSEARDALVQRAARSTVGRKH